ncbi:response regulator [Desulfovibrio mangrovi]|uniref:tetratricopeptide repeat protein n=1 Tax=Desulfovibrio mangrovi TaxID=2976983 RepID=UPI002246C254|nr:tetratricopeptide repeat protein [Desulfovibrio mangrovi]UZP67514.1 response regulator [Desulfovibrio mangrovi]
MSGKNIYGPYRNESVLVVSQNERHVSVDRKMLKNLGYTNVTHRTSQELGHVYLEKSAPDLLIVGGTLADATGQEFIRSVRKTYPDMVIPSVMVTLRNRKSDVLEAISAGCAGYVLRPYSMDTITRHLAAALESSRFDELDNEQLISARNLVSAACFDEAIEEFSELVPHENEADRYFSMGTRALMEGKFGKAIIAFNKALALNALYAEAYKGMADAYKGKGDMRKYQEHLKNAADIYAQQNRHQDVKDLFIEILRVDPDAMNPYNKVGMRLRKEGDYQSALQMYFQAQELSPDDEHLCFNIAKAYMYLEDIDSSCRYLKESLKLNPDFEQASALLEKLQRKKR